MFQKKKGGNVFYEEHRKSIGIRDIMSERERGRERVRGSYPRFHQGPPRRYSLLSEARYYGGSGSKQGATKWG